MIDTLRLTAEEAWRLADAKEISGAELFAAYLEAIGERDPELHCYLHVCEDPGGDGIPIAVKDVIGTKGIPTTAGSKILQGYVPVYDSTVARHCKAQGFRILCVGGYLLSSPPLSLGEAAYHHRCSSSLYSWNHAS